MEADDWEELKFLIDSAGIPANKAMGLEESEEVPFPSPEEFEENLKVTVKGEEFKLLMPDMDEYMPREAQNVKPPEIITPPPFLDIMRLLIPVEITPEMLEEAEFLEKHFEGMNLGEAATAVSAEAADDHTVGDTSQSLSSNSDRPVTPELILIPVGSTKSSVSVSKSSEPSTSHKGSASKSTDTASLRKTSHIIKERTKASHSSIPETRRPTGKGNVSSYHREALTTTMPKLPEEKRPSRPTIRIVSKEKKHAANPPIASNIIAQLPGSPSRHMLKFKSQESSIVDLGSRVNPRLPIKRSREEAVGGRSARDEAIEISDSSSESS